MGADEVRVPWGDPEDLLDRKKYAEYLTKWLAGKGGPFVLNINAEWGTGKTFFLRHWQAMIKDDHPVVYINAWESDFSDDPMIAVMASMFEQLKDYLPDDLKVVHGFSEKMKAGGRFIKHLSPLVAKGVVSRVLGGDAADEIGGLWSGSEDDLANAAEKTMGYLLEEHRRTVGSIGEFGAALCELVGEVTAAGREGPLFVFVDELDRCRPTYAVELLEMIKHLFSVDGVVYVISTDSGQLRHSVCALYGSEFDGEEYLRRFFDQEYALPTPSYRRYCRFLVNGFPNDVSLDFAEFQPWYNGFENSPPVEWGKRDDVSYFLSVFCKQLGVSLRSMNCLAVRLDAVLGNVDETLDGVFLIMLLVLYMKRKDGFLKLRDDVAKGGFVADFEEIMRLFGSGGVGTRWCVARGYQPNRQHEHMYSPGEICFGYMKALERVSGDGGGAGWDPNPAWLDLEGYAYEKVCQHRFGGERGAVDFGAYFDLVEMVGAIS